MKSKLTVFGILSTLFITMGFIAYAATDQGTPTFWIKNNNPESQNKITSKIAPGSVFSTDLIVGNLDKTREIEVVLEGVNVTIAKENEKNLELNWLNTNPNSLKVKPEEQELSTLTVIIPENTPDGLYKAMIQAKMTGYEGIPESQSNVRVFTASGMMIELDISETNEKAGNISKYEDIYTPIGTGETTKNQEPPTNSTVYYILISAAVILIVFLLIVLARRFRKKE